MDEKQKHRSLFWCLATYVYSLATTLQLGLIIRASKSGHFPPSNFILVTMGSTAVVLIGWRALLFSILPNKKSKKNDVYRRGSPFELFEVWIHEPNILTTRPKCRCLLQYL